MSVAGALRRVARRLGRRVEEVDPYIDQLKKNWYDDVASMSALNQDDLLAMGLPLRIAKELIIEMDGGGGGGRGDYDSPRKGAGKDKDKDKDKGRDKGKDKGKDRDKGKDKGKDRDKGKGRDEDRIIRAAPSKGKGKSKDKGKDKDKDEPARVHDIPIVTDGVEEDFPWMQRILGEKRRNAVHVQKETGADVWLSGGTTDDSDGPLTLSVRAKETISDAEFDRAVEMCEDLLEHVYEEAAGWGLEDDVDGPKKGKGKGKKDGKGKDKGKGKKGKDKGKSKGKGKKRGRDDD